MSKSALRHVRELTVLIVVGLLAHPAIASGQTPSGELARSGDCLESRDCPPIRSGCTPGVGQPICDGIDTDCNGATVGGLWGLQGRPIPEAWTRPWNERVAVSLAGFDELPLASLVERTVALTEQIAAAD